MKTTITIRTDDKLKEQASILFDSLGMSLSTALNMFMKQAVLKQSYPCALDLEVAGESHVFYPESFISLFGQGNDLGFDEMPVDMPAEDFSL